MGWKLLVAVYLLGGITFVPLVIVLLYQLHAYRQAAEKRLSHQDDGSLLASGIEPDFKIGDFEEQHGVKVMHKGWMTVTKQYYRHFSEIQQQDGSNDSEVVLDRSQLKKKHRFYAVLRHGNLFLYRKDEANSDLVHAIALQNCLVTLWPRNTANEALDASLFTKKTCISILKDGYIIDEGRLLFTGNSTHQFFLYFDNNVDKEDWYFQLINASKNENSNYLTPILNPNISAKTAHINTADMLYLIQTINSTEGQLTTKWINALLGRLFLSLQQTDALNKAIHNKLYKKLTKINKPGFLDDLVVEKVDVGNSAPLVMNPTLRELSPTGLTKVAFDVQYRGNLSIIVATKANINLGSRFKQREVSIKLSIKVKELSGPVLLLLKPPPSNRIWYAFEKEPVMDLEVEPVVSSSKLSYTMITNAIKSKFNEAVKESLVLPFMDDIVFYNTKTSIYRGGIWEKYEDKYEPTKKDEKVADSKSIIVDNDQISTNDTNTAITSSSIDTRSIQESEIKARSKGSSLKTALQGRKSLSIDNESDSIRTDAGKNVLADSSTYSEDSSGSKKYFKNSIKKIGKWYKENVNNSNEGNDEESKTSTQVTDKIITTTEVVEKQRQEEVVLEKKLPDRKSTMSETPKMISNRKRPVPKPPSQGIGISTANELPKSSHNERVVTPTSPKSTEMFVNHDRATSMSSSRSGDIMRPQGYLSPELNNNQAFVKLQETKEITPDFFNGRAFDEPNTSSSSINNNNKSIFAKNSQSMSTLKKDEQDNGEMLNF